MTDCQWFTHDIISTEQRATDLLNFLLLINGFLAAMILLVLVIVAAGLWKVYQGRALLQGIQEVHNGLTDSIAKVDAKAQEALLRLDQINNMLPKKGIF